MKLRRQFEIAQPTDRVWEIFTDIPTVAACLPGAELVDSPAPDSYRGAVTVRLGPFEMTFEGEARVRTDDEQHTMDIEGSGVDRRGGSRGRIAMNLRLGQRGDETAVTIDADVVLAGAAAQFGRPGLIEELATRLIDEFAVCLEGKLAAASPSEAAAVEARRSLGIGLFFKSLGAWLRKTFRGWFHEG